MENKEPIYYVNLVGHIKAVKSKKVEVISVNEIVAKGTVEQIKKCTITKKRFLRNYFNTYKKVKEFDLNRLTIVEVKIIRFLGYGVKRQ